MGDGFLLVLTLIQAAAVSWLDGAFLAIRGSMQGLLGAAFALSVVLFGYGVISGRIQMSTATFIGKIATLIVVAILATNQFVFTNITKPFFLEGPEGISSAVLTFSGQSPVGMRAALENVYMNTFSAADQIFETAWPTDLTLNLTAFAIIIAGFAFVAYAGFLLTVSKVAMAVLLALTPLMPITLLFSATRGLFERWVGMLFNFWFIPVLAYLMLSFVMTVAQQSSLNLQGVVSQPDGALNLAFQFIGICIVSIILMLQISSIASALGGGVALSTMGAVSYAAGKLQSLLGRQQKYTSGEGFEGRQRTVAGDMRRLGRYMSQRYRNMDRDGGQLKGGRQNRDRLGRQK